MNIKYKWAGLIFLMDFDTFNIFYTNAHFKNVILIYINKKKTIKFWRNTSIICLNMKDIDKCHIYFSNKTGSTIP